MADDVQVTAGVYTALVAADLIGAVSYQRVKMVMGADGAADMDLDSAQQTMTNSLPVVIASNQSAVATKAAAQTTATLANVSASATNVTVLASNAARVGATVYNDSASVVYLKLAATATSTSFTSKLQPDAYFTIPAGYAGIVDGIWVSATGSARVTEW